LNQTAVARPTLSEALSIAEQSNDLALIAEALDGLAQIEELEAHLDQAVALGERARDTALKSSFPEVIGRTHNNFALKLAIAGRPEDALKVLEDGRNALKGQHGRAAMGALDVSQAWVSWLMGRPGDVAESTARGRVAWQRWRGYRWVLETWSAIELGERGRASGTVQEAWLSLDTTLERSVGSIAGWSRETAAAVLSDLYLALDEARAHEVVEAATTLVTYARDQVERFDFGQMLAVSARVMTSAGRVSEARSFLSELDSLVGSYSYGYLSGMYHELASLLELEEQDKAPHLRKAISAFESCANWGDRARCLRSLASVDDTRGDSSDARGLLKEAHTLAEEAGALLEVNRIEGVARSKGMRLRAGRTKKGDSNALSTRELEVAALVAEGQTNAGIAGRLFISERTVQDHITHALRKLSLSSRAALASWAARNGLL
jgi:DNA-binding CsgD family transcriptional regulator